VEPTNGGTSYQTPTQANDPTDSHDSVRIPVNVITESGKVITES